MYPYPKKYLLFVLCCLFAFFLLYSIPDRFRHETPLFVPTKYTYPAMVKYSYQWPASSSEKTSNKQDRFKEIDRAFCGQDRCRFILPIAITEQESKAQTHFRQLAFLAGQLNRTIVLPNWLDSNSHYFKYITMSDFKAWIIARHQANAVPTGQEVYIQGSQKSRLLKKIKNCFRDSFDFSQRPIVNYQFLDHQKVNLNFKDIMLSLLSDQARQHEYLLEDNMPVDVIHLYFDRRYKFYSTSRTEVPLAYNERWVKAANQIASQLKPFMAIHWRMERLEPVSNLAPCAQDLIDKVHAIDSYTNHTHPNVFLLTDYPHLLTTPGAKPESSSFRPSQLRPEHHQAIQYLYEHLNITLTTIQDTKTLPQGMPLNWHILPINVTLSNLPVDKSVLGIVDKLVAMKAQWFLAGKPNVCAKSSSFTQRISRSRNNAFKHHNQDIVVPIQLFDMPY
ncbi:hypothetical protein CU098_005781 [Rhizopus stolonifer]|uniref:Peptide-O-fucosyltransferase n=1 Tax=Rhizopus stolonifer TaxID=4846 RepID=A0A367IVP5_RHIST|nr:hypothetical protein CU098_005781 [Rhizopus stolonifer]